MRAVLIAIFADGLLLVVANTFQDDIFPAKDVRAWNEVVVKFMVVSLFASIVICLAFSLDVNSYQDHNIEWIVVGLYIYEAKC